MTQIWVARPNNFNVLLCENSKNLITFLCPFFSRLPLANTKFKLKRLNLNWTILRKTLIDYKKNSIGLKMKSER